MRKIKHIVKALLAPITLITNTIIPCACSISNKQVDEPTLQMIKINLVERDFRVEKNKVIESQPIVVECFDNKKKPIEAEIEWIIISEDGTTIPDWINVDENNRLIINGSVPVYKYTFSIFAQDKLTKNIKSEKTTFNVYAPRLHPPQSIKIKNESNRDFFIISDITPIHLISIGECEGFLPEQIDSRCDWYVWDFHGYKLNDLDGNNVLQIAYDRNGCDVILSNRIDSSYAGYYYLTINANSIATKHISSSIILEIILTNDATKFVKDNYVYTRENIYQSWTLSSILVDTTIVFPIVESIFGYPVTKIGKNLCLASSITNLYEVMLPLSIVEIEESAFANQTKLEKLTMSGVKIIRDNAFKNCINVKFQISTEIPSLEFVGANAFYCCSKFDLTSQNNFIFIGESAFYNTGIKKINIGSNIGFIESDAFSNCPDLKEIIIDNEIPPKLGGPLFCGSTSLQYIKISSFCLDSYLTLSYWSIYSDLLIGY